MSALPTGARSDVYVHRLAVRAPRENLRMEPLSITSLIKYDGL